MYLHFLGVRVFVDNLGVAEDAAWNFDESWRDFKTKGFLSDVNIKFLSCKVELETYHEFIGSLIETDCLDTLVDNRARIFPRLPNSVTNHLCCLTTVELQLGTLSRKNNADFCGQIYRILLIAAVNHWKVGMFKDQVVFFIAVNHPNALIGEGKKSTYLF